MWPWKSTRQKYEAVAADERDEVENAGQQSLRRRQTRWRGPPVIVGGAVLVLVILLGIGYFSVNKGAHGYVDEESWPTGAANASHCPRRREWRSLSADEQQEYITAVLCLREVPSELANTNRTAYDDYPWIHSHVGYYTHNSAPFLPWHRYFLHIYELTLRDKCSYRGSLVYWDWTLDSEALEESPVFDPETGFGGDGEIGGEIKVGRTGRCVVNGPFANVTADYYDVQYNPHCLSRGFRDEAGNLGHMDGNYISPQSIDEVLSLGTYEGFVALMESRVHDAIPFGIGGDFETFTAPYDPLFFLHHTQLDRLWWLWQQRQPNNGLESYGGHKQRHSMEMAGLNDEISLQGLASPVKVVDVMDIRGELLCYTY